MKLAFAGKMRSGKNAAASFFTEDTTVELGFSDEFKQLAKVYFPQEVAKGKPRPIYQFIGQGFRQFDPDIWVKCLDRKLINLMESGVSDFIVTDVRQMNEYSYLKKKGFTVIKVEAEEEIRKERIIAAGDTFKPESFYHETELSVDFLPCDYLVTNNTTLEDLYEQLQFIRKELEGDGQT
ncbi:hypothetical protein [Bacillus licheniformis]|uniref:deoxynucleotide monophosphate kinase family protein n=1 Tax=Bacillus licheniformis TaxID=1402 RepID=UPI0011A97099|nr:hypothetical protein [Bacillus licheniformis]